MKKYFLIIISLSLFTLFAVLVLAQDEINYPVPELGNCESQEECKIYCDDISHLEECIIFAEEHNLIPAEELEETKKILAAIKKGITPPPCNTKVECDIYCSEPEHMEMCVAFAEEAGVLSPEELAEAKKVLSAIKKGATHPNCRGKTECDIYCCGPAHMEECVSFAEAADLISAAEAIMIRKTGGDSPGGCCGKQACDAYCDNPEHMKECMQFAKKYGLMPKGEIEKAEKMLEAGLTEGPGGCKGQAECNAYCNDLSHMQECIDFAVKAGFMTEEEAENAKKMAELGLTTGPGGCQGKEECDAFCENPDNMEECIEFGEKMGMISPEEKEMMMQGGPGGCMGKEECENYCKGPDHAEECIKFGVEQGFMTPEEGEQMIKEMQQQQQEQQQYQEQEQQQQQEQYQEQEHYGPPEGEMKLEEEPYKGEFQENKPPEGEFHEEKPAEEKPTIEETPPASEETTGETVPTKEKRESSANVLFEAARRALRR